MVSILALKYATGFCLVFSWISKCTGSVCSFSLGPPMLDDCKALLVLKPMN